jgi:hypothetical protein
MLPSTLSREERLGRALGFGGRAASARMGLWLPTAVAVAASVWLVMGPWATSLDPQPPAFVARGALTEPQIGVFVLRPFAEPLPLSNASDAIEPEARLAFTYLNPRGHRHLMIFAIDARGAMHWYHPAWTDARITPRAVAIEPSAAPTELPEAIRHRALPRGPLRLVALFSGRDFDVRTVERAFAPGGLAEHGLGDDTAVLVTREIQVR